MKLENICNFIDSMVVQCNKVSYGRMALQWRKDLKEARSELANLERMYHTSNSEDARSLTLKAYAEKYLNNKWA